MKIPRKTMVGKTADGKLIMDGRAIFVLMDSHGMPLDLLMESLREHGQGFDTIGLMKAALESGNYTLPRIKEKILEGTRDKEAVQRILDKITEREVEKYEYP